MPTYTCLCLYMRKARVSFVERERIEDNVRTYRNYLIWHAAAWKSTRLLENSESEFDQLCTSSFVLGTCWLVCTGNNLLEFKPGNSALASGLYPRCQLVTGITNGFLLINKVSFINDEEERNRWEDCKLLGFSERRQRLTRCNYSHRDLINVRSKSIIAPEPIRSPRTNNNKRRWIYNEISNVNGNFVLTHRTTTALEYQSTDNR